jgi:PAS domain S-box-containing protein
VAVRRQLVIYAALPAAYVISGRLGLLLAVPPGYATAVFLPAGIAVAAMFVSGPATLPGTYLGSFLLNIWIGYSISHQFDVTSVAAALVIAFASMLQAAIGGALLRRVIGGSLDTPRDLLLFLLLSPVFCLTSATLSLSCMLALGAVHFADLMINWMTWWVGDTLGVLVALPLTHVVAGQPRALRRSRARFVAIPMVLCFALFVTIFVRVSRWENEDSLLEFRMRSQHLADVMKATLEEQAVFLEQLSSAFTDRHLVITRQDFHNLVQSLLPRFPTIQAVEWAPRVVSAERDAFEAAQRVELPGFVIRERDSSGRLRPASDRSDFYPITYLEPISGNEEAAGYNLASNADRRAAIDAAITTGNVTATAPIRLVQERGEQVGILLTHAVSGGPTGSGIVLVVLRMGTFAATLASPLASTLRLRFVDTAGGRPLFEHLPALARVGYETSFDFGRRRYLVQTAPSTAYLANHRGWQSWAVLVAGALSTGLLGALLMLGTGHAYHFEKLAEKLRESEAQLAAILEQIPLGVGLLDRGGRFTVRNTALKRCVGEVIPSIDQVIGDRWRVPRHDGQLLDRSEWPAQRALRGETVVPGIDFIYTSEDGQEIWMRMSAAPFRRETGELSGAVAVIQDVDAEKRTGQANLVLIRELQHRTRNLLAVVQSLAHQTIRGAKNIDEFEAQFNERLAALARVQRFLSRPDDQPVTCGELVRGELAALASNIAANRIVLEGPEVPLPKRNVYILALALHELATNALKHGALTAPHGHLMVTWRVLDDGGQGRHLTLDWLESGLDTIQFDIHSMRRGYGRELIEKALVYQLGAKTRIDSSDGSIHCVIEIPVETSHSA